MFRLFVPPDDPLVSALRDIDWQELGQTLESFYSVDKGQPAISPVRKLKLEFLRYQYNLSDRQATRSLS